MSAFRIESPIERLFFAALLYELANLGACVTCGPPKFGVDLQFAVGAYRADFYLTHADRRVAVECDGHDFHERTAEQAEHDRRRDRFFQAEGIIVLRFTGREINRDPFACAQEALRILRNDKTEQRLLDERRAKRIALRNERWLESKRRSDRYVAEARAKTGRPS